MRKVATVQRDVEVTIDVLCNKCGESCVPPTARKPRGTPVMWNPATGQLEVISQEQHLHERGPNLYGLIESRVTGGYDSYALRDCEAYTFSLCEGCLKALFDTFTIPVQTREADIMTGEDV